MSIAFDSGFIDLHCHYIPGVDDGVRDDAEGIALCKALASIGYARAVATPHIRTGMFDNRGTALKQSFERFAALAATHMGMPDLGLGAEHFFDDVLPLLTEQGETLPYPGGKAILVELPPERMPLRIADQLFRMRVRGLRPVIAHPERYTPLFKESEPLLQLLDAGAIAQLDVMSLLGKYGRKPQAAAERMLDEGIYDIACSDSHRPADVDIVAKAIEVLRRTVGDEEAHMLLVENPQHVLAGTLEE